MTKNTHYSYDYSQPKEYHFSLDSVFLAQKIAKSLGGHSTLALEDCQFLDLCAGCGVIGLELQFHLPQINKIDFVEVQEIYRPHFEKNIQQTNKNGSQYHFLNINYSELLTESFFEKYDFIVSNPPYFFVGEGLLSPSNFKNRCRFFIDSNFEKLIEAILFSLKKSGKAYLLARSGLHHGRSFFEDTKKISNGRANVAIFDQVRGTNIIEISKIF